MPGESRNAEPESHDSFADCVEALDTANRALYAHFMSYRSLPNNEREAYFIAIAKTVSQSYDSVVMSVVGSDDNTDQKFTLLKGMHFEQDASRAKRINSIFNRTIVTPCEIDFEYDTNDQLDTYEEQQDVFQYCSNAYKYSLASDIRSLVTTAERERIDFHNKVTKVAKQAGIIMTGLTVGFFVGRLKS